MKLESEVEYEFQKAVEQVMEWLNKHGDPHMKIQIDQNSAELLSGEHMHKTGVYIRD